MPHTPDYHRREVFANAPLELVAAEVRYPYAPRLRKPDVLDAIQIDLDGALPIRRLMQHVNVEVGPAGAAAPQSQEIFRLFNKGSTLSASITPTATTVETTDYEEFDRFAQTVHEVLKAVQQSAAVVAVERIGLRYIDEIRVPGEIRSAQDWKGWLSEKVTAAACVVPSGSVRSYQGAVETTIEPDRKLVFRYAALDGRGIVDDNILKRRSRPKSGPFFVIDIDSFWEPSNPEGIIDFDADLLREHLDALHGPTGEAFQNALTDRVRTVFRNGTAA